MKNVILLLLFLYLGYEVYLFLEKEEETPQKKPIALVKDEARITTYASLTIPSFTLSFIKDEKGFHLEETTIPVSFMYHSSPSEDTIKIKKPIDLKKTGFDCEARVKENTLFLDQHIVLKGKQVYKTVKLPISSNGTFSSIDTITFEKVLFQEFESEIKTMAFQRATLLDEIPQKYSLLEKKGKVSSIIFSNSNNEIRLTFPESSNFEVRSSLELR